MNVKGESSPLNVQKSSGCSLCLASIVSYVGLALFTEWFLFSPSKQSKLVIYNGIPGEKQKPSSNPHCDDRMIGRTFRGD